MVIIMPNQNMMMVWLVSMIMVKNSNVFLVESMTFMLQEHHKIDFLNLFIIEIQCNFDLVTNPDLVTILQKTIFLVHKNISFSDNLVFSATFI